jgi:hypothetical protein
MVVARRIVFDMLLECKKSGNQYSSIMKVCLAIPENDPLENVFNYQLKRLPPIRDVARFALPTSSCLVAKLWTHH